MDCGVLTEPSSVSAYEFRMPKTQAEAACPTLESKVGEAAPGNCVNLCPEVTWHSLVGLYDSGAGIPKDEPQAARFFERARELGNVVACESAAVAHASGHGVPKSFSQAAVFYEEACDGGWSPGCTNIGALYEAGAGVDKDLQKAKAYYAKGCELESAESCRAVKRLSTR